ncbi:MAG: ATP-binding cassette domain-containing protein [Chloroflexi bacterium]|nr:ATP-binding cassette domain-containing protein [Chloroflexota bacterium]
MIEVQNLVKHFGPIRAVDGVSLVCQDGEVFGLLGPNGAGKTTTLRMLATMLQPVAGTARVDGHDVLRESTEVRQAVGVLPETVGLYGRLTAREQLRYFGRLYGLADAALERRIEELLTMLEMADYADRRCEGFSKGMRQKVALARALIHDPRTMILDEPTAGLDVMSARSVRDFIDRFRQEGRCVLLSTHVMSEAERLCDRIAIIHKGKILVQGTPDELRQRTGEENLEEAFVRLVGEE